MKVNFREGPCDSKKMIHLLYSKAKILRKKSVKLLQNWLAKNSLLWRSCPQLRRHYFTSDSFWIVWSSNLILDYVIMFLPILSTLVCSFSKGSNNSKAEVFYNVNYVNVNYSIKNSTVDCKYLLFLQDFFFRLKPKQYKKCQYSWLFKKTI